MSRKESTCSRRFISNMIRDYDDGVAERSTAEQGTKPKQQSRFSMCVYDPRDPPTSHRTISTCPFLLVLVHERHNSNLIYSDLGACMLVDTLESCLGALMVPFIMRNRVSRSTELQSGERGARSEAVFNAQKRQSMKSSPHLPRTHIGTS